MLMVSVARRDLHLVKVLVGRCRIMERRASVDTMKVVDMGCIAKGLDM